MAVRACQRAALLVALFVSLTLAPRAAARVCILKANAGPDQKVEEGETVTLDGSGTRASCRLDLCTWTQTAGPPVSLSDPEALRPTFTAPEVGPQGEWLSFELTVTDESGLQNRDTCRVKVAWVNDPPVAEAGPDQKVEGGAPVALDGSASADPDDGLASWTWTQTSGPPVALSEPDQVSPGFTAPEAGPQDQSLTFALTVTDKHGLKSTDTCTVILYLNQPPRAEAGPDQEVDPGVTVILDGSSSSDPNEDIVSYKWRQTDGLVVPLSDPASPRTSFVAPKEGEELIFRLTVTDKGGLKDKDKVKVRVKGGRCFLSTLLGE